MVLTLRWWHFLASHAVIAALCLVSGLAWLGWHRAPEIRQVVSHEVQQVPVGATQPIVVTVPGVSTIQVPQIVTAPAPDVRIITTPAPVVVTPAQQAAAEAKAPVVITVPLVHLCVHPDQVGLPDPTCGKSVDPDLTLVATPSGGYARLATTTDTLQTGPIATRVNGVAAATARKPWEVRVGAGVSTLFGGSPYLRGEVNFHPFPRFDALYVGAGVQRFLTTPAITNGYVEIGAAVRF